MRKIKLKIDLAKQIAPMIGSRDVVRDLSKPIKKTKKNLVDLDFKNVEFISRSAAHELLILKETTSHQSKTISFVNTSPNVSQMLRAVAANRALPSKKPVVFNPKVVTIESLAKLKTL